jgi:diguanylate cyclase
LADQSLALLRDLIAADDDPQRTTVAQDVEACRKLVVDETTEPDQVDAIGGRIEPPCRTVINQVQTAKAERAKELASLVLMIREVMSTVGSEMSTFQNSIQQSTNRFEAIGELNDPRQIKARLVAEVIALKQIAVDQRTAWEATTRTFSQRVESLESQLVATKSEASSDALTGLANRRLFDRTCREWVHAGPVRLVLCLVDVDDFKAVNDTYGHAAGDEALKAVSRSLSAAVRQGDLVARIGGDEFAMLVPDITLRQAEFRMGRVLAGFAGSLPETPGAPPTAPSLSCGIAEFSAGDTVESLFQRADEALYAAKRQGKNRVVAKTRPFIRDLMKR